MKSLLQAIEKALDKVKTIQSQISRCEAAIAAAEVSAQQLNTLQKQKATVQAESFLAEKPADTRDLDKDIAKSEAEHKRLDAMAEAARDAKITLNDHLRAAQVEHETAAIALGSARYTALRAENEQSYAEYDEALVAIRRALARIEASESLAARYHPNLPLHAYQYMGMLRRSLNSGDVVNSQRNRLGWLSCDDDAVKAAEIDLREKYSLDA